MSLRALLTASSLMGICCVTVPAQAALQGRDLDGSLATFEAYYDTALNITWLADANYAKTSGFDADGKMDWVTANLWVSQLVVGGYDHWRLPDVGPVNGLSYDYTRSYDGSTDNSYNFTSQRKELAHLFYVTLGNPGFYDTTGAPSGCYVFGAEDCFDNPGPFVNAPFPYLYWNAGEAPTPAEAWVFRLDMGALGAAVTREENQYLVWAVHPGDVGSVGVVPEPEAYALWLAGLGCVGLAARRRRLGSIVGA